MTFVSFWKINKIVQINWLCGNPAKLNMIENENFATFH